MDTKPINQRRNYFIEKEFQRGFILRFCLLIISTALLTGIILYMLCMQSATVSFENLRATVKTTADFLMPILIQTIVVVTIIVGLASIILTMLISHRIGGPLYRIKKELKRIGTGDFRKGFHIRTDDQFQNLALDLNEMIKRLRENHQDIKASWQLLKDDLHKFLTQKMPEEKEAAGRIEAIIQELEKKLDNFKV